MKIFNPKHGWMHKITPEEMQDIRDWLPSEEAARKFFDEQFTKEEVVEILTSDDQHNLG
jgi:hypothetical protein